MEREWKDQMDVEHGQLKSRQHHQTYAKVGMGRGHEESAPMRCGVGKGCACDMVSICHDWDRRVVVVEVGCVVVENHCLNCQRCREHQVYWNHSLNRSLNHGLRRHDENDAVQLVKHSLNHSLNHSQCRRGEKTQSYHHGQSRHRALNHSHCHENENHVNWAESDHENRENHNCSLNVMLEKNRG